jgi:hypothetical protein
MKGVMSYCCQNSYLYGFQTNPFLVSCFQITRPVGVRISRAGPIVVAHNSLLLCELTAAAASSPHYRRVEWPGSRSKRRKVKTSKSRNVEPARSRRAGVENSKWRPGESSAKGAWRRARGRSRYQEASPATCLHPFSTPLVVR